MSTPTLADELLGQVPVNHDTTWSAGGLGLDPIAFNRVAQRVLELETQGAVDVINLGHECYSGSGRLTAIRFIRTGHSWPPRDRLTQDPMPHR